MSFCVFDDCVCVVVMRRFLMLCNNSILICYVMCLNLFSSLLSHILCSHCVVCSLWLFYIVVMLVSLVLLVALLLFSLFCVVYIVS